jgi:FixJ family two-component response regulator
VSPQNAIIAVVDDDPRVLESLEELFESAGHVVRKFSSAKALLDAGLSGIGCLVSDIGMPAMDGFELHDVVKKTRPDLPVFLLTGRQMTGDQQRALATGISGFFRKPFDGPALLGAVGDALQTHGGSNADHR